MNLLLLSLIPPFVFALSNHLDKYIVSRYFSNGGTGTLIIYSSFFGILALPIIFVFHPAVFSISLMSALAVMLSGICSILGVLLYLYALNRGNVSSVAPLFQLVPLFTLILGFFILNETLLPIQILGGLLILAGSIGLSIERAEKVTFKQGVFWLMSGASLLMSLSAIIFKVVAIRTDYWTTAFWSYAGTVLIGLIFFIFIASWRSEFLGSLCTDRKIIFVLNILNEIVNAVGALVMAYATLLAPVALIQFVSGTQPLFVLVIGILLAFFLPFYKTEHLSSKDIIYKFFAIFVIFIGLLFIY